MANPEHVQRLREGAKAWNEWRAAEPAVRPDLAREDLTRRNLRGHDLRRALLVHTRLSNAKLDGSDFRGADLRGASLRQSSLQDCDFRGAVLRHANLSGANVQGADFSGCEIFGAGLWQLQGQPGSTQGMRVFQSRFRPAKGEPLLLADSLDSAQFLFLLLDNPRITEAFNALNQRIVLLLGRFTEPHLQRLQWMRERLAASGYYVPILFDFDRPADRSLTETVAGFAHLAFFVIADLTEPKSVPQELSAIVPFLPSVPVVPLVAKRGQDWSMFPHFLRYPWVLDPVEFGDLAGLQACFDERVLKPAEQRAEALRALYRRVDPPAA